MLLTGVWLATPVSMQPSQHTLKDLCFSELALVARLQVRGVCGGLPRSDDFTVESYTGRVHLPSAFVGSIAQLVCVMLYIISVLFARITRYMGLGRWYANGQVRVYAHFDPPLTSSTRAAYTLLTGVWLPNQNSVDATC
jgi:hypothetical protein